MYEFLKKVSWMNRNWKKYDKLDLIKGSFRVVSRFCTMAAFGQKRPFTLTPKILHSSTIPDAYGHYGVV